MSETTTAGPVTLADLERLCWHLSGWQVDQRSVDELLAAVQAYAAAASPGAGALVSGRGEGEAVRLAETPAALTVVPETPEAVTGAQTGVQRIEVEVTGTLTLACASCQRRKTRAAAKKAMRETAENAVPEDWRTCRTCTQTQPIDQFVRDSKGIRGRKSVCRVCENRRKRLGRQRLRAQEAA